MNMIKLFTHTDLDGIGCAVLAKLTFGDEVVDVEYCGYDDINAKVEEYFNSDSEYECHITDISINDELANKINDSDKKYQLLDHHPTALELSKYEWCDVQIEDENTHIKTSGTELYYYWLIDNGYLIGNSTLKNFVELVRDYDTWRWSTLGDEGIICKQVNNLLYLYGRENFIDWCIAMIQNGSFPMLTDVDKIVLEIKQREIDSYIEEKCKSLFIGNLCGRPCGIVFADKYISELGNRLCQMYSEFDFVAIINMDGTVSYRTIRDDIDLGKDVAKVFGGGGHPKAAGSQISEEIRMNCIREIFS
jgi:oligoribonuclease NrnB/cAMP/cGMP phosphodiesterase (DHH superfamily)